MSIVCQVVCSFIFGGYVLIQKKLIFITVVSAKNNSTAKNQDVSPRQINKISPAASEGKNHIAL